MYRNQLFLIYFHVWSASIIEIKTVSIKLLHQPQQQKISILYLSKLYFSKAPFHTLFFTPTKVFVLYWVISWFCFDKLSTLNSLNLSLCLQTSSIFWKAWACFFEHEQENHMHCRNIHRESSERSYDFLMLPGFG